MNKHIKRLWYFIAIACLIVFSLILISSVISIGEKLRNIHVAVEIAFYVLVIILVFFGIINPIRIILSSPSFEIINTLEDNDSLKVRQIYKKVAQNIVKNNDLPEQESLMLQEYRNYEELQMNLQIVFNSSVKKQLNGIIIKHAKTVLISTAICQNAKMDMFTVFSVDLNMIKDIVMKCGFRPSMKNLSKLTLKVFTTSLIAEGLESITMEDILPQSVTNTLNQIPLIKPVMSSVSSGILNALLTIRIGIVTRKYLFKDGTCITKEDIRRSAFKDSLLLLPQVIAGTLTFIPKKIVKLFTKKPKEEKPLEGTLVDTKNNDPILISD